MYKKFGLFCDSLPYLFIVCSIDITNTAANVQASESVQESIVHLVNSVITPEDFQIEIQKHIQFPIKEVIFTEIRILRSYLKLTLNPFLLSYMNSIFL